MINRVKIILYTGVIACCFISCRQAKNKSDYFVGYWMAFQTTANIVIFKDTANRLQMVIWDNSTGKSIDVLKLKVTHDTIKTKEFFTPTKWTTDHVYTIVNDSMMDDLVSNSDGNVLVHYKRIK